MMISLFVQPRLLVVLLLGLAICAMTSCTTTEPENPNILWITSEDNSPYLGAYGDSLATTPNLDRLAERGVVYENAYATTPVCAPARFTLITGTYANVMGTENMRSTFPIPSNIQFFPEYLREAGYHTTNNVKKDYNTVDQPEAWVESSDSATYKTREPGQPFFHVRNFTVSHESRLHDPIDTLIHDPEAMNIPPYHPETEAIKTDWAHYYDQITKMDAEVGELLEELEASGEAENTIIMYYGDHGGVLPRSKRFMFESGLRVPLIAYFPPKYRHLAPDKKRVTRLVSFVDFAPTVLSIAGIEPPEYMHGKPFLGEYEAPPRSYVHLYRGRMDERFDLARGIHDGEYLYVRNFMPHRIYGQHLAYLWRAPSMQSWHREYQRGNLNATQRRFFETKPPEELYHRESDPHSVNNLADDPDYSDVLKRMREANNQWMIENKDLGFIPEETINNIRNDNTLYDAAPAQSLPIEEIIKTAQMATRQPSDHLQELSKRLNHADPSIRFWAATGFSISNEKPASMAELLLKYKDDESIAVRTAVAEALYRFNKKQQALDILQSTLKSSNTFAKLRALNTIEALNVDDLPSSLQTIVQELIETHNEQWGTDYYIRRAARTIIDE